MTEPEDEIVEVLARESAAWERQDAEALVGLHHPDMVSQWPPGPDAHNPIDWVWGLGRFDRERWMAGWRTLFSEHHLVRNERIVRRVSISPGRDAGLAVVDVDTLWQRHSDGQDFHWQGRACEVYTKVVARWLLIMHGVDQASRCLDTQHYGSQCAVTGHEPSRAYACCCGHGQNRTSRHIALSGNVPIDHRLADARPAAQGTDAPSTVDAGPHSRKESVV